MAAVRHPEKMGCQPGGMATEVSGWNDDCETSKENGMSAGYDCTEISGWNGGCETSRENGMSAGYDCSEISGWNGRCHKLRTLKSYGNLCICLTPRKPVLHSLYQVPTFLGMLIVPISENTKVKKGKKRRYRCTQKIPRKKRRENREKEDDGWVIRITHILEG